MINLESGYKKFSPISNELIFVATLQMMEVSQLVRTAIMLCNVLQCLVEKIRYILIPVVLETTREDNV